MPGLPTHFDDCVGQEDLRQNFQRTMWRALLKFARKCLQMLVFWGKSWKELEYLMLYEYVFVREIRSGETRDTKKKYPILVSQTGDYWRCFNGEHAEINKPYVIGYELSENGQYKNIKEILPLQNVWLQQALKEISSKLDINKTVCVSTGYAKDLCSQGILDPSSVFEWADKFYDYITKKTDSEFDRINNSGINPKDIKVPKDEDEKK